MDPSSSRDVIFSPCAVARIKPGLRKPIGGRLAPRERMRECVCVCSVLFCVCVCDCFPTLSLNVPVLRYWTVCSEYTEVRLKKKK